MMDGIFLAYTSSRRNNAVSCFPRCKWPIFGWHLSLVFLPGYKTAWRYIKHYELVGYDEYPRKYLKSSRNTAGVKKSSSFVVDPDSFVLHLLILVVLDWIAWFCFCCLYSTRSCSIGYIIRTFRLWRRLFTNYLEWRSGLLAEKDINFACNLQNFLQFCSFSFPVLRFCVWFCCTWRFFREFWNQK